MDIFVGNLLFEATGADVKKLFEGFGNVASVVIVMSKEKKTPKSRGFGFVQMPDEQQALAAIAVLNGKEFMGRLLNVNPARPKTEAHRESKLKKKEQPKFEAKAEEYLQKERERGKTWFSPVFNKHLASKDRRVRPSGQPGTYRGGRRTRSYINRRGLDGMQEETKPRRRSQDNPMRWRKKKDKPRPWQKSPGEHKPWEKVEGEARPWKKAEGESKPWRKSEGGIKPWKKPAGDAKPWSKSSRRPQKSRFNPSTSLGMVRGNGERSRTKGRRKPGGNKR
jgi:RNA recognition motif-containing protein